MGHAGVSLQPPAWPSTPQRRFAENDGLASHPHRPGTPAPGRAGFRSEWSHGQYSPRGEWYCRDGRAAGIGHKLSAIIGRLAALPIHRRSGASSTVSSQPSAAPDACSSHSLLPAPPAAWWRSARPQWPTMIRHNRRRPHRLRSRLLRCGSNVGARPGCPVKKSGCLRHHPAHPEPRMSRNG